MHVGERIYARMKELGISQNKLAKIAQISQSGLSSIISGASSPKENTLQAIAAALGCSVSDLLGDSDSSVRSEDDVWQVREQLRRSPDMRMLFSAASKAPPEHIRAAAAMLKALEPQEDSD